MPVALNSQLGSKEQADAQLAQAIMSAMRVAMPGIIQSFDPDAVTAVVQPAIKGAEQDESGAEVSVNLRCWWMFLSFSLAVVAAR
jgi:hypothetical protein